MTSLYNPCSQLEPMRPTKPDFTMVLTRGFSSVKIIGGSVDKVGDSHNGMDSAINTFLCEDIRTE